MNINPIEIQQKKFHVRFRGFDVREVDGFLEEISELVDALQHENETLGERVARLEQEAESFKEREETFKRALLNSQKVMEQMKANAHKSAELIIADAEVRAEKILNRAHNRLAQLHEDIAELKRQRVQIEIQLRAIIDAHAKLLDVGNEEALALDEEDAKIKFLSHSK